MTGICLPIDASGGAPAFPGAQHRVALGALMGALSSRPLGARSGIRPGCDPTVTVTSTTWTVTPFNFVADPDTGSTVGAYIGAFLANETGNVNAADQSQVRYDRLDVCVPDDPPGSDPRNAWIEYTAGTPGSGVPAAPEKSFPLVTITVPQVGAGAPSFVPTWPYLAAPGAPIPVRSLAERNALTPFNGLRVARLDLGTVENYNGTAWKGAYYEEFTLTNTAIASSSYAMVTALTPSKLIGTSAFNLSTGLWTSPADDLYNISFNWGGTVSGGSAIRCTTTIIDQTAGVALATDSKVTSGYPGGSVSVDVWIPAGHQVGVYVYYGSAGQSFEAGTKYSFRRVALT